MSDTSITIYLNDHLALAVAEAELARRTARENSETDLGSWLSAYADEVERQKGLIEQALAEFGGRPSSLKQAAGWLAEKLGRLKPNDALIGYTDLARVIELESLTSAAQARLLLWETLGRVSRSEVDIVAEKSLVSRQLAELVEHHRQAIGRAFHSA